MLIETSYEMLMSEYLRLAPEGIDIRQGSIFYDAGAGFLFLLNRFYNDLNSLYDMVSLTTASGEYLRKLGVQYGVEYRSACPAIYTAVFEPSNFSAAEGARFFIDGHYFKSTKIASVNYFTSETSGSSENIFAGKTLVPVNTTPGLTKAMLGTLYSEGKNNENENEYRKRIQKKLSGPAENGNKLHYRAWCESVEGVGAARIIPLDPDINYVKAVIIAANGFSPSTALVSDVQNFVDPNQNGDGAGAASISAVFTAVKPVEKKIGLKLNVKAKPSMANAALNDILNGFNSFLSSHNLTANDAESSVIRASQFGAIINSLKSVEYYDGLYFYDGKITSGGEKESITLKISEIAVFLNSAEYASINIT